MSKRTYSRRTMTKAPDQFDSPPEGSDIRKRRKADTLHQTEAPSHTAFSSSRKAQHQKPKSKKFSGPVSIVQDDDDFMDVDVASPTPAHDPFEGTLRYAKEQFTPQRSLYSGRQAFENLMKANQKFPAKTDPRDGDSPGLNCTGAEDDEIPASGGVQKLDQGQKSLPKNEHKKVLEVTKVFASAIEASEATFKGREYESPTTVAPSKDLYGNSFEPFSPHAQRWSENQTKSSLLRLPFDVRRCIFELALGGNTIDICFQSYRVKDNEDKGFRKGDPVFRYRSVVHNQVHNPYRSIPRNEMVENMAGISLLNNICRQLYVETSVLPYRLNHFAFRSSNTLFNYMVTERRLTEKQCKVIKELTILYRLPCSNVIALLPNLKRIRLVGDDRREGWWRVVRGEKGAKLVREAAKSWYEGRPYASQKERWEL